MTPMPMTTEEPRSGVAPAAPSRVASRHSALTSPL